MTGTKAMHNGAYRTDRERLQDTLKKVEFVDNSPAHGPEHKNWNLRPRDKTAEVGPQFKTKAHL